MSGQKKESKIVLCDPYVWEDPRYLFRTAWFGTTRPTCASELVNQTIFIYVFSIIIGLAVFSYTGLKSAPLIAGLASTLYLIPTFLKLRAIEGFRTDITRDDDTDDGLPEKEEEEGFTEYNNTGVIGNLDTTVFQSGTSNSVKNPFHNVTIDQIKYAPTRKAAPDITTLESKVALDDFFRVNWYNDPTDVFGKTQSQRMFVSQPSTTIPNDQGSYQDWLYKIPGKTCKEGNPDACYGGTDGGALPWLNL
jgi:hypothetical protein